MKRYISLMIISVMLLIIVGCAKQNDKNDTTEKESVTLGIKDEQKNKDVLKHTSQAQSQTVIETSTAKEDELPQSKKEVVLLYKQIMDKAKKDKPGFTRLDYQELLDDEENRVISDGGALLSIGLAFADNFMKTKEQSQKKPTIGEKGGDMKDFPVKNTNYGCFLTGEDGVKSAECVKISDDKYKINIVLYPENNPEPAQSGATKAPSFHGSVCSPISKKEIDEDLATGVFSGISYSLRYHDCLTELVYNPENMQIYSQTQTNRVTIKGEGTIGFVTLKIDRQELINHVDIIDLKY